MKCTLDLHIHSRYARACSKNITPENISYFAQIKGVDVVGCGDFTHPLWLQELKTKLEDCGNGLFRLKEGYVEATDQGVRIPNIDLSKTYFMLTTEVSCIYSHGGKTRRLHILLFAPTFETVENISFALGKFGKLSSDGRPMLGIDARSLMKIVFDIDPRCMVVPAHAWTPWFAVFGSKSGFDSLLECFGEWTPYIYAIETGLSSDPKMNWQISALDSITLLSNSDAHSCGNIAREANVFDLEEFSYAAICDVIKKKDRQRFLYTIEFYPEEGMYHYDGHRLCKTTFSPEETRVQHALCPVCKREMTIGVLNRVQSLADRPFGFVPENAIPYRSLVGLDDIIAEALGGMGKKSKAVLREYESLIEKFGNEIFILLDVDIFTLKGETSDRVIEGIQRNREGRLSIVPGFDGQYGQIHVFSSQEDFVAQRTLFS